MVGAARRREYVLYNVQSAEQLLSSLDILCRDSAFCHAVPMPVSHGSCGSVDVALGPKASVIG
jgi:hypothetical protein